MYEAFAGLVIVILFVSIPISKVNLEEDYQSRKIRCPKCFWEPKVDNLWCCGFLDVENYMGCGFWWNTFDTKGVCPGCNHQWSWTTCLNCGRTSLHRDWYEK